MEGDSHKAFHYKRGFLIYVYSYYKFSFPLSLTTGVSRCLKVVHSITKSVSIGEAMVTCAADQARLAPVKTCDEVT